MRPLKVRIILNNTSNLDLEPSKNYTKILYTLCSSWESYTDIITVPIMHIFTINSFFGIIQGITWLQTLMTSRQEVFSGCSIIIGLVWVLFWVIIWTCQTIEFCYNLCNFVMPPNILWGSLSFFFITFSLDIIILIYNYFDKVDFIDMPLHGETYISYA